MGGCGSGTDKRILPAIRGDSTVMELVDPAFSRPDSFSAVCGQEERLCVNRTQKVLRGVTYSGLHVKCRGIRTCPIVRWSCVCYSETSCLWTDKNAVLRTLPCTEQLDEWTTGQTSYKATDEGGRG